MDGDDDFQVCQILNDDLQGGTSASRVENERVVLL